MIFLHDLVKKLRFVNCCNFQGQLLLENGVTSFLQGKKIVRSFLYKNDIVKIFKSLCFVIQGLAMISIIHTKSNDPVPVGCLHSKGEMPK